MRQVDTTPLDDYTMPSGLGDLAKRQACVVAQAAILDKLSRGEEITEITDTLQCACPVLGILAIALNDGNWWESDEERAEALNPLRLLLLDSRRGPEATAKRARRATTFAKHAAEYAAEDAKRAARTKLRDELLKCWRKCEAIQ